MPQSQAGREAEMLIHASFPIGHLSLVIFHFLHVVLTEETMMMCSLRANTKGERGKTVNDQ